MTSRASAIACALAARRGIDETPATTEFRELEGRELLMSLLAEMLKRLHKNIQKRSRMRRSAASGARETGASGDLPRFAIVGCCEPVNNPTAHSEPGGNPVSQGPAELLPAADVVTESRLLKRIAHNRCHPPPHLRGRLAWRPDRMGAEGRHQPHPRVPGVRPRKSTLRFGGAIILPFGRAVMS